MEAVYENIDVGILDKLVGSGEENEVYVWYNSNILYNTKIY